jgi:carotenoid cleavage dioxygenase-like enzyme
MDLPLSLDPLNLMKNKPVVSYDPTSRSRFGVFPRYQPHSVYWFETNPCCIFHTANTWDSVKDNKQTGKEEQTVHMLACRLTSASLVFSAGDLTAPVPSTEIPIENQEEEQCRLYYYQFPLTDGQNAIRHQWALSAVDFEFPSMRDSMSMTAAKYIYGCSADTAFGAALGKAAKIDSLVKMDVETLINRGIRNPPTQIKGCVDLRTVEEVRGSKDPNDPIKIFKLPPGWFAQETRFIPRDDGASEDDGWLVSYVFDESQLDANGTCQANTTSELWIIDAKNMTDVVAKVLLPQRVPYGLHGTWFSEEEVASQRPIESIRQLPSSTACSGPDNPRSFAGQGWMKMRRLLEQALA